MKITWTTILLVVAIVLATLYIESLFDKTPPNEKIIRSDIKIEQLEKKVIADSIATMKERREKDSTIAVLNEKYDNLEKQKQPIRNALRQVHIVVSDFDKEQLRRGSKEFYTNQ